MHRETDRRCCELIINYMERVRKSLSSLFYTKLDNSGEGSSLFTKNGSKFLKELIAQGDGRSNISLRNYSSKEISQATNNFCPRGLVSGGGRFSIHRGLFENCQILIKRYIARDGWVPELEPFVVRDIVISSHMNFHKNVVKLIGYCLDYEYPALIYQSPEACDFLHHHLADERELKLTLGKKVSIALDIANVLAYLHTGFQTPVIHRNLKLGHVVIDKFGIAKFMDFSSCIAIPLGECQLKDVVIGTKGYADPMYVATGILTEKSDVFNFGVILFELLIGKRHSYFEYGDNFNYLFDFLRNYSERDKIESILNGDTLMEAGESEKIRAFAALALECTGKRRDSRPEMVEVSKELRRIQRLA